MKSNVGFGKGLRCAPAVLAAAVAVPLCLGGCTAADVQSAIEPEAAVQVKDVLEASPYPSEAASTIEDYTWEELSDISAQIAAASSDEAALEIAKQYNLVNDEGKLDGSQVKSVTLSDGTELGAMIIGFAHDRATSGGTAGISFIFTDCVSLQPMNAAKTNDGGWEASELREWLSTEGLGLLPEDLQKVIVSVEKESNDAGDGTASPQVVTTSDKLWLLSTAEVCGETAYYEDERDELVNAEGSQYQLFSDCDVDPMGPNAILLKSSHFNSSTRYAVEPADPDTINASTRVWWLRTANPSDYSHRFRCVRSDGDPATNVLSSYAEGVVPGFSI